MQLAVVLAALFAQQPSSNGIVASIDLSNAQRSSCTAGANATWLPTSNPTPQSLLSSLRFPHFPMGGRLDQDLLTGLWIDLDPAPNAVLDWNCTDHTYDGHEGIDVGIKSWGEQSLGVPVFAASDGTVVFAQDGWP